MSCNDLCNFLLHNLVNQFQCLVDIFPVTLKCQKLTCTSHIHVFTQKQDSTLQNQSHSIKKSWQIFRQNQSYCFRKRRPLGLFKIENSAFVSCFIIQNQIIFCLWKLLLYEMYICRLIPYFSISVWQTSFRLCQKYALITITEPNNACPSITREELSWQWQVQ